MSSYQRAQSVPVIPSRKPFPKKPPPRRTLPPKPPGRALPKKPGANTVSAATLPLRPRPSGPSATHTSASISPSLSRSLPASPSGPAGKPIASSQSASSSPALAGRKPPPVPTSQKPRRLSARIRSGDFSAQLPPSPSQSPRGPVPPARTPSGFRLSANSSPRSSGSFLGGKSSPSPLSSSSTGVESLGTDTEASLGSFDETEELTGEVEGGEARASWGEQESVEEAGAEEAEGGGGEGEEVSEEMHEKRTRIVTEILETEKAYVQNMDILKKFYEMPLVQWAGQDKRITKDGMKKIFSNIDLILGVNQELLSHLEKKMDSWPPSSTIGDVFVRLAPIFKMYNDYGNNYDNAIAQYNKYMKEPSFAETLQKCDSSTTIALRLEALLIMPVQRVPRYNLLLSDLLNKTPETHPDKKLLATALDKMTDITKYLNADIKTSENQKKFLELGKKGAKKLIKSHRKLITHVVCQSVSKGLNLNPVSGLSKGSSHGRIYLWLFSDIMVVLTEAKAKNVSNMTKPENIWPLNLTWIKDIGDKGGKFQFELAGPNRFFTLKFGALQEKSQFLNEVRLCQTKLKVNPGDEIRTGEYEFVSGEYFQGGKYKGTWCVGEFHGKGLFEMMGNRYEGDYHENQRSGMGTLKYVTGEVYEGQWLSNRMHGHGTLKYKDGSVYEGGWASGTQHGQGEFKHSNGDIYKGEWQRGSPHGTGELVLSNKVSYNGGWKAGEYDGQGTLKFPNGKTYEGGWRDGLREGEGTLTLPNGDTYTGRWKADKRHGVGKETSDQGVYDGEWVAGLREGKGTCTFPTGDVYEGQWKRGTQNGKGTMKYQAGSIVSYTGVWENGNANGHGCMIFRDKSKFDGTFKNNRPHGNGTWTMAGGIQIFTKVGVTGYEGKTKIKLDKKRKFTGTGQGCVTTGDHKVEYDLVPMQPVFAITDSLT